MEIEEPSEFLDPGPLKDGDLELILVDTMVGVPDRGLVPEYKFEMRNAAGAKAGKIALRTYLTEKLSLYGGHIGYEVEPEFRGARFAARSCRLLFDLARGHGITNLLITCDSDNIASRKTAESAGAKLVRVGTATTERGTERDTCYYEIDLQEHPT